MLEPPVPPDDHDGFIEQENRENYENDLTGNMENDITDERKTEDADLSEFETFVDEEDDGDTYLGEGKLYNRIIIHCSFVL